MFPETTLLNHLLNSGYDVYDDFLEVIENIADGKKDLENIEKSKSSEYPMSLQLRYWEEYDEEEIEFLKTDIETWEQQIAEIKSEYKKLKPEADWQAEVDKVNE